MSKYTLPSGAASIEGVVGFNTEKEYTSPLSKRNIHKALMESLYVNLEQQIEIADLKLAVQVQYNAAMTLDEENQIARKEINELKAMVNALRRAADLYHGGYKVSELEEANSIMVMSPAQCLQSVKADAIIEAIEALKPSQHGDSSMIIACEHFLSYANKLREGES